MSSETSSLPAAFEHSTDSLRLRQRLFTRLVIFLCLETAFIALAITCLKVPTLCPLPSSKMGAGFTVLFIAWHTFAVTNAQYIVLHGFSSEWYIRYQKTGELTPSDTDVVSTIGAGIWVRLRYFFSKRASPSFRISFLAFWLLAILGGIAPGVINVGTVPQFTPTIINITNFTVVGGEMAANLREPINLVSAVVESEAKSNISFGFENPEHLITGWPNIQPGQLNKDIKYGSDVVFYNMSCWWEAPSTNTSQWGTTWYAGGYAWYPWATPLPGWEFEGGIITMWRFSEDQKFIPDKLPDPLPAVNPVGMSGYLFHGRNSSFPDKPSDRRNLSLDRLPTIFNSSGFFFTGSNNMSSHFQAPLATFLLCDPQGRIVDGQIAITQADSSINIVSMSDPVNGVRKVGNIPIGAANVALGLSLLDVLESTDQAATIRLGGEASKVFLNDTSLNFDSTPSNHFDVGILSTEDIQRNLNRLMNSAAKGVSTYFRNYGNATGDQLFLLPVDGAIQSDQPALVASRDLLFSTIGLFASCICALVINIFYMRIWNLPSFKLETLIRYGTLSSEPKNTPLSSTDNFPRHPRYRIVVLTMRLLGFISLEVAFVSLVITCMREPLFIDITLPSAETKGVFTALFISWQALATFLLSEVISFAFSSEWSLPKAGSSPSSPGNTDWVSRLTSGVDDRTRYFLTKWPTNTFRAAFFTSLLLTTLSSVAPGALSVSEKAQAAEMSFQIADLRLLNSSRDSFNYVLYLQQRADSFVRLEKFKDSVFKYDLEPNWIMAWPDEALMEPNIVGNIEFPTDVVRFNYSCTWKQPEVGFDGNWTVWSFNDQAWSSWGDPEANLTYQGGILPLYRYLEVQPDAMSAYLFIGTNDSYPNKGNRSILNVGDRPSLVHTKGLTINATETGPSHWLSPLSTVLLCDPHIEISGGRVRLTKSKQLNVIESGLPVIGNLPDHAVTTIFHKALLFAIETLDSTAPQWICAESARAFLTDSSLNYDSYNNGVPVLDDMTISHNLNTYFLSASKAFTDGIYFNPTNVSALVTQTRNVTGQGDIQKQMLEANRALGITSACLAAGAVLLFAGLMRLLIAIPGVPFELEYILQALGTHLEGPTSPSKLITTS